ncbi:MAG: M15 family metallopeptidase [Saprospiraceae bacterium]
MKKQKLWIVCCLLLSIIACETPPNSIDETKAAALLADSLSAIARQDSLAELAAKKRVPDYDTLKWTELIALDSTIIVDMKYATTENFVKEKMYNCSRCFLRPKVAIAVTKAQQILQKKGYGLKMLDCYRPLPIQQKLWDKVPNASYVTPPKRGSMHNRGSAVDLTIVNAQGEELDMGTEFDFFGKRAHHDFTDLSPTILANRTLLKNTMKDVGFQWIRTEWWHYYFKEGAPGIFPLSKMLWSCEEDK